MLEPPAGSPDPASIPTRFETLALKVDESRGHYTVAAQLPGVLRQDIDIALDDARTLRIAALRRDMVPGGLGHQFVRIERSYILPKYADPDNMRADLEDGNLVIVIHKMPDLIGKKKPRFE